MKNVFIHFGAEEESHVKDHMHNIFEMTSIIIKFSRGMKEGPFKFCIKIGERLILLRKMFCKRT